MLNTIRWGATSGVRQLVVMCHGVGADASQMAHFAEPWFRHLPHTAFIAPDAPYPFDFAPGGHQWFSLADRTPSVLQVGAARATPALNATIDAERDALGLPDSAIVLAGFSQGAMMVLYAGLRRPNPPGAILAYSGALLDLPPRPAAWPPVLLVHGESDAVVPFTRGLEAERLLRLAGVPIDTCWCRGVEHFVDEAGLSAGLAILDRLLQVTKQ